MRRSDFEIDIKTLKYFLYVRKSDESEDRQVDSIADQISVLNALADELKIEVVDIFTEARSAKAPGRPVFDDMIVKIKRGKANAILCWKPNRLSRNPIDSGTIGWLLQEGILKHIQPYYGKGFFCYDNVMNLTFEQAKDTQIHH